VILIATLLPTRIPASVVYATDDRRLPADTQIAGVAVGGLLPEQARERLHNDLNAIFAPLTLRAGPLITSFSPTSVSLVILYDAMIAEAQVAGTGARVPLRTSFDEAALREQLRQIATSVDRPAIRTVITSTLPLSRSFALEPGRRLDTAAAAAIIGTRLRSRDGDRSFDLDFQPDTTLPAPDPALLQAQIEAATADWKGVAGVAVYSFDRQQPEARLNGGTVFSGASVMKAAILLNAYTSIITFTPRQEAWLKLMIEKSDNWSANQILAASVGGTGVRDALRGANRMTDMLRQLGLEHTYQYAPYNSSESRGKLPVRGRGPAREGDAPYTEADPWLRTTPVEMSQVFIWIEQCSHGDGPLLPMFPQQLSPARCREMVDRLRKNEDQSRMVSGLPPSADVAHKSGWIDDMQADVGIIHSPGGDFVASIYLYYRPGTRNVAAPTAIGRIARLIYSYYNPPLDIP
jgi:beta-lactamase class A